MHKIDSCNSVTDIAVADKYVVFEVNNTTPDLYVAYAKTADQLKNAIKAVDDSPPDLCCNRPRFTTGSLSDIMGRTNPFEDPNARKMFFDISIEIGKAELIHGVLVGVCYHLRWQLEVQEKKVKTSASIGLLGGGTLAPLTWECLALNIPLLIKVTYV